MFADVALPFKYGSYRRCPEDEFTTHYFDCEITKEISSENHKICVGMKYKKINVDEELGEMRFIREPLELKFKTEHRIVFEECPSN